MNNLISLLPGYERNSQVFIDLFNAIESEFSNQEINLDDLKDQLFLDTATWALEIFESASGIKTDLNKSYDERRSVIRSKWRGHGKINLDLIKSVVDSYYIGDVNVDFNGKIIINFLDVYGEPNSIDLIDNSLNEIKPAHLGIDYIYLHYNVGDIHNTMTINDLETMTLDKFKFQEVS